MNVPGIGITVFYPHGKVSDIQYLQMATQEGRNVAVAAVEGNFDDVQSTVKKIFASDLRQELADEGVELSSANSINIGRLVPQVVYYFDAYRQLVEANEVEQGAKVDFCVPTGNFGDVLAGYYAYRMGLPVRHFIVASNANNVLTDFLTTGVYDRNRPFVKTITPSMDILISEQPRAHALLRIRGATRRSSPASWRTSGTRGVFRVEGEMLGAHPLALQVRLGRRRRNLRDDPRGLAQGRPPRRPAHRRGPQGRPRARRQVGAVRGALDGEPLQVLPRRHIALTGRPLEGDPDGLHTWTRFPGSRVKTPPRASCRVALDARAPQGRRASRGHGRFHPRGCRARILTGEAAHESHRPRSRLDLEPRSRLRFARHGPSRCRRSSRSSPPTSFVIEGCPEAYRNADNLVMQGFRMVCEKARRPVPAVHLDRLRGARRSRSRIFEHLYCGRHGRRQRDARQSVHDRRPLPTLHGLRGPSDNAAPAFLGGLTASFMHEGRAVAVPFSPDPAWCFVAVIPNYEVRTEEARRIVRRDIDLSAAVHTMSHAIAMVRGLETGDEALVGAACADVLHEPYRRTLIAEYDAMRAMALEAGAATFFISGSGSTMIAATKSEAVAEVFVAKVRETWPDFAARVLTVCHEGTTVTVED